MDHCDYGSWVSYLAHKEAIDSLRAEVEHWKEVAAANKQVEEHWLRRVRELLAER